MSLGIIFLSPDSCFGQNLSIKEVSRGLTGSHPPALALVSRLSQSRVLTFQAAYQAFERLAGSTMRVHSGSAVTPFSTRAIQIAPLVYCVRTVRTRSISWFLDYGTLL